ncbi:MAG: hypothetical protein QFF03_24540 [Pseudomonadota bacterium]|nr:hypothetical protein [Pseudomonadota bacterium]
MNFLPAAAAAAAALLAAAAMSGCATLTDSNQQEVLVRAVLDHHEVSGVGCVLSNQAGRWFVMAPGRVTIRKSVDDLAIDCKKDGVGATREAVASHVSTANLIGNVALSAGLGYYVDRHSGAGFDYPLTLTVILRPLAGARAPDAEPGGAATPLY